MTHRRAVVSVAVLLALLVVVLLLLSRCSTDRSISGTGSSAGSSIVGDWRVTYGAPAVMTIARSHAGYTMRAKTPVRVTSGSCDLPPGTVIATFAAAGRSAYAGQHGLWIRSNCTFDQHTRVTLTLHRDGHLSEVLGNGERHTLTRA